MLLPARAPNLDFFMLPAWCWDFQDNPDEFLRIFEEAAKEALYQMLLERGEDDEVRPQSDDH